MNKNEKEVERCREQQIEGEVDFESDPLVFNFIASGISTQVEEYGSVYGLYSLDCIAVLIRLYLLIVRSVFLRLILWPYCSTREASNIWMTVTPNIETAKLLLNYYVDDRSARQATNKPKRHSSRLFSLLKV